jgi:transcriptional regulator with XRE-family HTH domain
MTKVANLLKKGRQRSSLSLRQAALAAGCSDAQISLLENGKSSNPTIKVFLPLVTLYRLPLNEVMVAFTHDNK